MTEVVSEAEEGTVLVDSVDAAETATEETSTGNVQASKLLAAVAAVADHAMIAVVVEASAVTRVMEEVEAMETIKVATFQYYVLIYFRKYSLC